MMSVEYDLATNKNKILPTVWYGTVVSKVMVRLLMSIAIATAEIRGISVL